MAWSASGTKDSPHAPRWAMTATTSGRDWREEFVHTEWAASYRWAARTKDGSVVDYCEGDVSIYPASENPDIEAVWLSVLEYVR